MSEDSDKWKKKKVKRFRYGEEIGYKLKRLSHTVHRTFGIAKGPRNVNYVKLFINFFFFFLTV